MAERAKVRVQKSNGRTGLLGNGALSVAWNCGAGCHAVLWLFVGEQPLIVHQIYHGGMGNLLQMGGCNDDLQPALARTDADVRLLKGALIEEHGK